MQSSEYTFAYGNHTMHLTQAPGVVAYKNPSNASSSTATDNNNTMSDHVIIGKFRPDNQIGSYRIQAVDAPNDNVNSSSFSSQPLKVYFANNYQSASSTAPMINNNNNNTFIPTGQMYIKFKADISEDTCNAVLSKYKAQIVHSRGNNEFTVKVSNPIETAIALQKEQEVQVAEPDLATSISTFNV